MIRRQSGQAAGRLEQEFGVGDGSGRVWRSWMAGTRLARAGLRRKIFRIASENGWLDFSAERIVLALQGLPESAVQNAAVAVSLVHPLILRLEAPPPPTAWLLKLHSDLPPRAVPTLSQESGLQG